MTIWYVVGQTQDKWELKGIEIKTYKSLYYHKTMFMGSSFNEKCMQTVNKAPMAE